MCQAEKNLATHVRVCSCYLGGFQRMLLFSLSPKGAEANSQGREALELTPSPTKPQRGGSDNRLSTVAPSGLWCVLTGAPGVPTPWLSTPAPLGLRKPPKKTTHTPVRRPAARLAGRRPARL